MSLCPALRYFTQEIFFASLRDDPARHLIGCDSPLMGVAVKLTAGAGRGLDDEALNQHLLDEVKRRVAPLDEHDQESAVARARRSLEATRLMRVSPPPDEGEGGQAAAAQGRPGPARPRVLWRRARVKVRVRSDCGPVTCPVHRGGRPCKAALRASLTPEDWQSLAGALAEEAHEDYFPSRRGVWYLERYAVLCLYNNNPYTVDPARRDRELAEFRRRLQAEGIAELAFATYPPEGDDYPGYTYALLMDAGADWLWWASDTMAAIVTGAVEDRIPPAG